MFKIFIESWKGKVSLAKAFWIIYVLVFILLVITISIILLFVYLSFPKLMEYPNLYMAQIILPFPYLIYAAVCVWRCSNNATYLWKYLARTTILLHVLNTIILIVQVFIA